jgi:hypothetical protein
MPVAARRVQDRQETQREGARQTFWRALAAAGEGAVALAETRPLRSAGPVDAAVVGHFRALRAVLVDSDNRLGPFLPLPVARQQLNVIDGLRGRARGGLATALLATQAQWAELTGWLCDDLGLRAEGELWLGRAAEMAVEAGDSPMLAYVLARKAQRAVLFGGSSHSAVQLADAARRYAGATPLTCAFAAVITATGHATGGDTDRARKEIDAARDLVARHHPSDGLGGFCSPGYVWAQEGECWLRLGQPQRAAEVLDQALRQWPAAYEREKGLVLARLAAAFLASGDPDCAGQAALAAADAADRTGSARIFADVVDVAAGLERCGQQPAADQLLARLAPSSRR